MNGFIGGDYQRAAAAFSDASAVQASEKAARTVAAVEFFPTCLTAI
jgi:hypothetical protein